MTRCTVSVTYASEPIPSQYNGELAYTTVACGRELPCVRYSEGRTETDA